MSSFFLPFCFHNKNICFVNFDSQLRIAYTHTMPEQVLIFNGNAANMFASMKRKNMKA